MREPEAGMEGPALTTRLLVALFAPGSVEGEVCRVQDSLFARYGFVSSIALVPLIPVLFLPSSARNLPLESFPRSLPAGCRFAATGLRWVSGGLYLGVDSGGGWQALREHAARQGGLGEAARHRGPAEPPLFAEAEGFCLGCWEAPTGEQAAMTAEVPAVRFSSCTLALVSVTVRGDRQDWWREVYLETMQERPLRCRPAGAARSG